MGMQRFWDLPSVNLLALCIYGEARGESREGKVAVGSVIAERVKRGGWYGKNWKEVILKPRQFSCFNMSDPNFTRLYDMAADFCGYVQKDKALSACLDVARGIKEGTLQAGFVATHYKTKTCKAAWTKNMDLVAIEGSHEFYV